MPPAKARKRGRTVVILESDFIEAEDLRERCEELGFTVLRVASRPADAFESILRLRPDYALIDCQLGAGLDGMMIVRLAESRVPETRFLIIGEMKTSDSPGVTRLVLAKPVTDTGLRLAMGAEA
ncbi:hypothetical protein [Tranquillimonas alkanivorans]|uniref:Response regulator receiver domain-containing protein n=1 Tax=Tranquillimonas alkanivorans TaxID=441119 RepID=A0A1I5U7K1_9RHOB|nr:hypothetical protein [Tranquillimonas alkanivorans]SFP91238.1 Response regulator receiver domain-containing protein [Tranquillimonas alkanivorans]